MYVCLYTMYVCMFPMIHLYSSMESDISQKNPQVFWSPIVPRNHKLVQDHRPGAILQVVVLGFGVHTEIPGCFFLVGGSTPSEKYEFVNWDDCSQNIVLYHVTLYQHICHM